MKRNSTKLLSIVIIASLLMTSVFLLTLSPVKADTDPTDFDYQLINGDTEVEITGYHGPGGDLVIPSIIDGNQSPL